MGEIDRNKIGTRFMLKVKAYLIILTGEARHRAECTSDHNETLRN